MLITIRTESERKEAVISQGESLLDAINKTDLEGFEAPCGGKGTCGKCRVRLEKYTEIGEPDASEMKHLSETELQGGIRLACRVIPEADMEIFVSASGRSAVIQSEFSGFFSSELLSDRPPIMKRYLELKTPAIDDQRSDLRRFLDAHSPKVKDALPLERIRELHAILKRDNYKATAVSLFDELLFAETGNTEDSSYAAAVDIGTTTVVVYLLDAAGADRGKIIDFASGLNSQKGYGSDVISRIEYTMQKEDNLEILRHRIVSQVSGMVNKLAEENEINPGLINMVTIAGNTTMTHIFAGMDPEGIASAPFIPVDTGLCVRPAMEFGLELPPGCYCAILPGIASYVGSDITSGIAAAGIHETEELSLLIDIGTNGEIVLGSSAGLTACSTAAGPALEGANISCGMGGVPGAVNSLTAGQQDHKEAFSFSVIGDTRPLGICGSGIVDAVAVFVTAGLIDETGRILTAGELSEAGAAKGWIDCLIEVDGSPALRIAEGISLTQKDVREVQMAKAAIAAGVKTLLSEAGKSVSDVKKLYVAGGFGSAMNKHSAAVVGLFPLELEGVVEIAGNTAGKGAVLAALSEKVMTGMSAVADEVNYIELSTSALFQQEYMMAMYFSPT